MLDDTPVGLVTNFILKHLKIAMLVFRQVPLKTCHCVEFWVAVFMRDPSGSKSPAVPKMIGVSSSLGNQEPRRKLVLYYILYFN